MKIIVFGIFMSFSTVVCSQNIVIGTKLRTEDKTVENENTIKTVLFEMLIGDNYKLVKKVAISNCENYNTYPKYPGKFRMTVQAENYQQETLDFEINRATKDTLVLEEIVLMKAKAEMLNEVTITGVKKSFIKVEADKTIITVKDNEILSSGSVYDAITKLPGVLLDPNGSVNLNGKATTIWIDGQPTNLSGQDLTIFLNNLPGNVVEKVEIISNPGASYEASTAGGIINIITASKSMKGVSGTANINYSKNNYDKYGASLVLNGRVHKMGWQLSAGKNFNRGSEKKNIRSDFQDQTPIVTMHQNSFTEKYTKPVFLRMGIDFYLNKTTTVGLKYNLNTNKSSPNTMVSVFSENASPDFDFYNSSNTIERNTQNEFTSYYKQKLDTLGREFNVIVNWSIFDKNTFNSLIQNDNSSSSSNYGVTNNGLQIDSKYIKADLSLPYSRYNFTINLGAKFGLNNVNSDGLYNSNNNNPDILVHPVYVTEIKFNYKETNFAYYAEFRKKIDQLSFNLGLRFQSFKIESKTDGDISNYDKSYSNFFPSISMLYQVNNAVDFSLSYTRKIEQPGYSQLDPNINGYYDNFTNSTGNPALKPTFFNNYEVKLTIFKYAFLNFNYSYARDQNLQVFENVENLQTNTTYKSFEGIKNYNFNIAIPIPFAIFNEGTNFFKKSINIEKTNYLYLFTGLSYYDVNNAERYFNNFKNIYTINAFSQIILPLDLKLGLNYLFNSKGTYQVYQINSPIHKFDLTLSKSFVNKNLKVTLGVKDLFNTFKTNAIVSSPNLKTDYSVKSDSQSFYFGISYSFGKYAALHKTAKLETESDKDRIEKKTDIIPN